MYFDGNKALTYNSIFNFVIGNRSSGKTYWCKKWAIKDFIKNGKQFIYLRRYGSEFEKGGKDEFWKDIIKNNEFSKHSFTVKGYTAFIDNKEAGYFRSLNVDGQKKSVPYPNVNKIIYDEFLIDKDDKYHSYLQNEVKILFDFYDTVDRMRDETIVFLLGNAMSKTNPFFTHFKIDPTLQMKNNKLIKRYGDVVVMVNQDDDLIKAKQKTRFGKIIDGTKYGDFNMKNKFILDDDNFVEKKSKNSIFLFAIVYKDKIYGIWVSWVEGKMWVSEKYDPLSKLKYCVTTKDHSVNTMLINNKRCNNIKMLIENFKLGNVRFESINIKNMFMEVISLFINK